MKLWITATMTDDCANCQDGDAHSGWVDYGWSATELLDERPAEPVATYAEDSEDGETVDQWRDRMLERYLGAVDSDDGETAYAADGVTWDYGTAEQYRYAAHTSDN